MLHEYFARQTRYDFVALMRAFDEALDSTLPPEDVAPTGLHKAMRADYEAQVGDRRTYQPVPAPTQHQT